MCAGRGYHVLGGFPLKKCLPYLLEKGTHTGSKTGKCRRRKRLKILVNKMRAPKFRIFRCIPSVKPTGSIDTEGVCRKPRGACRERVSVP